MDTQNINDFEHEHLACDGEEHEHHHHSDGSCCCHHHEVEFHGVDRLMLIRLIAAGICFAMCMIFPVSETAEAVLMIATGLIAGYDVVISALRNLFKFRFFDEYFLMTFAAIAACLIGEFEEGAAVMLLYRIGETCQEYAIRRSKKTISSLSGDYSSDMTEHEGKAEKFITKFAKIYTPVILILAVLIAAILPVFTDTTLSAAVYRALTFLVLACPCAIVISVPLSYFAGIGAASRKGIFFHDSTSVDVLSGKKSIDGELEHVTLSHGDGMIYSSAGSKNAFSADVVFADNDKSKSGEAIRIARKTKVIIHENIWFTILVKLAVLVLAVFGISELWFAVFADSGVAVIVILNSIRAFKVPRK